MRCGIYLGCFLLLLSCASQGRVSTEPTAPFLVESQDLDASESPLAGNAQEQTPLEPDSFQPIQSPDAKPLDDSFQFAHAPSHPSSLPSSAQLTSIPASSSILPTGRAPAPLILGPKQPSPSLGGVDAMSLGGGAAPPQLLTKTYSGKPISLDLMDADVRNVLRLIADITGTNMVIEPDVSGRVTLKVEKVPWDQILDIILAMNSLGHEHEGNVIRVAREARLKEEKNLRSEALRAQQAFQEVVKDAGELATVYFTINYADPKTIATRIGENKGERGRVSIDERTNLVIYSDAPARIADARHLIARLDRPTSQVLIEARIVTLNSRASRRLGINWSLETDSSPSPNPGFQINVPMTGATAFGFNIARLIGLDSIRLDARIEALESLGEVQVLAAPNVMTLNNVQAVINQGIQIPYLQQTAEGTPSTVFQSAVVELKVIPHITPDRRIRMKIDAKQDEPGVVMNQQVSIETRNISTELFVEDGEIVVIGGVMRDRREKSMDGTPGLHRVPLLGRLFKSENTSQEKTQLLIFISPKVIDPHTVSRR